MKVEGGANGAAALNDIEAWYDADKNAVGGALFVLRPATDAFWAGPFLRMQAALRMAAAVAAGRGALTKVRTSRGGIGK